jgi:hypothetical protein
MSKIWDSGPETQGQLLVILALSDYANDSGECWPSMASIARKTRMTERGTQKIVRQLETDGWLKIETGNGRHGCNRYHINPEPRSVNTVHPELETQNVDTKTPNKDAETPNVATPEPSITIKEPSGISIRVSAKTDPILASLSKVASVEAAESFIAYRKRHKAKALSLTAANRLGSTLQEIFNAGHDPDDALGMAEERGWATVKTEWYLKEKGNGNDRTSAPRTADQHRGPSCYTQAGGRGPDASIASIVARRRIERGQ